MHEQQRIEELELSVIGLGLVFATGLIGSILTLLGT